MSMLVPACMAAAATRWISGKRTRSQQPTPHILAPSPSKPAAPGLTAASVRDTHLSAMLMDVTSTPTSKVFTVVTQFITADGTTTGTLSAIKRFYVQNGKVIPNSMSEISGVTGNSITDAFCTAQKTAFGDTNEFEAKGGKLH